MTNEPWPELKPGEPASYRIMAEGLLDERWSGRLSGMQIVTRQEAGQKPVTTLSGQILDQAALIGVLNSLYQLHMKILSVTCETRGEHERNKTNGE